MKPSIVSNLIILCFAAACLAQSPLAGDGKSKALLSDPLVLKAQNALLTMPRQSWEQGMCAQMFLETGDEEMLILAAKGCLIHTTKDGRINTFGGGVVDAMACGEAVWNAAKISGDPDLRKGAEKVLKYALTGSPRAADGLMHGGNDYFMVDFSNYAPPFLAAAGHYDEAIQQIEGYRKRLWDPRKRLYHNSYSDKKKGFVRADFWGGGCGWMASSLMRIIRVLPPERKADREKLSGYLKELLDGCLAVQRPDGLFHDVLDKPETFVETNCGQMLAYAIYESVRGGWLSPDYLPAADRMRLAARAKIDRHGLIQGAAAAPSFDKPGVSPEAQAFFVMMENAALKLNRPLQTGNK